MGVQVPPPAPAPPTIVTVEAAAERFLVACTAKGTDSHYRPRLSEIVEALGEDKDITAITVAACREYAQETVHRIPSNRRKKWPSLSLAEAIKRADTESAPRLAYGTKEGHVTLLRNFFQWCEDEGLVTVSPARNAPMPKGKRAKRKDYNPAHLKAIFAAAPYKPDERDDDPAMFWVFPIALFSGMRRDEIVRLRKEDVKHERKVWFFDLQEDEAVGRSLKNAGSIRRVPIHPTLQRMGLLDYVAKLPKGAWLFASKAENPGDAFGKKWARHLKKLGIKDKALVLHSTRHSFSSAMRDSGVEKRFADRIGGWSGGGVAESYGRYDIATLAREMAKLTYEGLNLKRLYRD